MLTGGERTNDKGYFYRPTLLKKISLKMLIAQEEVFGPVAPITIVEDENEAINLANDSEFRLRAGIWTEDMIKLNSIQD